jgi:argininosuccinate lyase
MSKLWQTSSTTLHPLIEEYTVGNDHLMDMNLLPYDLQASLAHGTALNKIGIINDEELKEIKKGLAEILELFNQGKFVIKQTDEDCHTAIENYLIEKLGPLGKKIHTGRSRNDQVLVATRLYAKAELKKVSIELINLQKVFLDLAKKYEFLPLPGYTHTRRAMPSSIGHWASAYLEELINHHLALEASYKLNDQNPLGAAAGFGINLALDRNLTTELLGFSRVQKNSLYAVNSRGPIENNILSTLCQIMLTLGRMANEMIFFTTPEFNFFQLSPEFTTGSSMMPQKRNPDPFEVMRGNVSVMIGLQTEVQNICKSLISGYNRDTQLTKEPLIKGFNLIIKSLQVASLIMGEIKPNEENLKKCFSAELFATHQAIKYVKEGMAFRDAYQKVKESLDQLEITDPVTAIKEVTSLGGPGNLQLDNYQINKPL